MTSASEDIIPFGRGYGGTLNDLKSPKDYHYTDSTRLNRAGKRNTVGDRQMISNDVKQIKSGAAKRQTIGSGKHKTTRFVLGSGRTYRVGGAANRAKSGTLYPEKGPGLSQLDKKQGRALGTINKHGLSVKSQVSLSRQNARGKDVGKALGVWQRNKGKGVSPRQSKDWKNGLERKFPKTAESRRDRKSSVKRSPDRTQSKSISKTKVRSSKPPPPPPPKPQQSQRRGR